MSVTWNPADIDASFALSNSDLTITKSGTGYRGGRATASKSSGKWYWEITADRAELSAGVNCGIGIANATKSLAAEDKGDANSCTYRGWTGNKSQVAESAYGSTYTTGDIIGVALDLDAGKIWWSKNGIWQAAGDPAVGTNEAFSGITGSWFPYFNTYVDTNAVTVNFGDTAFNYAVPSGFSPFGSLPGPETRAPLVVISGEIEEIPDADIIKSAISDTNGNFAASTMDGAFDEIGDRIADLESSSSGSIYQDVVAVSSAITISPTATEKYYLCSSTAAYSITLPSSALTVGNVLMFFGKANMTYPVTLDAGSGIKIGDSQTKTLFFNQQLILRWDGSNWEIVNDEFKLVADKTFNVSTSFLQSDLDIITEACPRYLNGYTLNFQLADGIHTDRKLYFHDMFAGTINVLGNSSESGLHTTQAVVVDNSAYDAEAFVYAKACNLSVNVVNIKCIVARTSSSAGVQAYHQAMTVLVNGCYFKCNSLPDAGQYPIGVNASWGSSLYLYNTYVEALATGVTSSFNSHVISRDNGSTGTPCTTSLVANSGGVIAKRGTQPSGESAYDGGVIR